MKYLLGKALLCGSLLVCGNLQADYIQMTKDHHFDETWDIFEQLTDQMFNAAYIAEKYRKTEHDEIYQIVNSLVEDEIIIEDWLNIVNAQVKIFNYMSSANLPKYVEADFWNICYFLSNSSYLKYILDLNSFGFYSKKDNEKWCSVRLVDKKYNISHVLIGKTASEKYETFKKKYAFHENEYRKCIDKANSCVSLWTEKDCDNFIKTAIISSVGTAFIPQIHIKAATVLLSVIGEYVANQVGKYRELQSIVFECRYHAEMALFYQKAMDQLGK